MTYICSMTELQEDLSWKFRLSSALGQEAQQRYHLLLVAHQAVGDDVCAPVAPVLHVLRGRHIQQQRIPGCTGSIGTGMGRTEDNLTIEMIEINRKSDSERKRSRSQNAR